MIRSPGLALRPVAWVLLALACQRDPAVSVRVGTYNLRNLSVGSGTEKIAQAAWIIGQLDADVVLLQEVGGQPALDLLGQEAPLAERYVVQVALSGNDRRGFGLAVLSRLTPTRLETHRDDWFDLGGDEQGNDYQYARDCLELEFELGGRRLVLLGIHFRSMLGGGSEQRVAEAGRTRRIALDLMGDDPEALVAVVGDFNDVPGSPALSVLQGDEGDGSPRLASVAATVPPEQRFSWEGPDSCELLDDLLVSPALRAALVPGSVTILHDHDLPAELVDVSDHDPLAASFSWNSKY